jgi:hypothetical protein
MSVTIRVKRGTATQWAARTTALLSGEIGYDLTNKITKIGDGTTLWASLPSIDSSGGSNTGDVTFDGVQVIGAGTASGDGYGLGTLELVPDGDITSDQYLIIDPTAPNHIHIRAGGTQDASTADLFIGGERNHVRVSDGGKTVSFSTKPQSVTNTYTNINSGNANYFVVANTAEIYEGDTGYYSQGGDLFTVDSIVQDSPSAGLITVTATSYGTPMPFLGGGAYVFIHDQEWNNYWYFDTNGVLNGPSMGALAVNGLYNNAATESDLWLGSSEKIVMAGVNGEFLNDASIASNQIATMADITSANEYTDDAVAGLGNSLPDSYVPISDVGNAGGVASLDVNGKIPLSELGNLIDGAPEVLNTLNELAEAINDDASYAATITTALGNKLDSSTASSTYAPIANPTFTGTVGGISKSMVGLGNVDNTTDANKPVSTATQTALELKLNLSDPAVDYYITNSGSGSYTVNGVANGLISFDKGKKYKIYVNASGHPFWIQTVSGAYSSGDVYSTGITGNGTQVGSILVELPDSAPSGLYYACQYHSSMAGAISVKSAGIGVTTNTQSSSYTLAIIDSDKIVEMSGGGTLTIADSSSFPVGFTVDILQTGSSQVTIAGSGFTPNATPGLKLRTQWSSATLIKRALNSWVVLGDLSA